MSSSIFMSYVAKDRFEPANSDRIQSEIHGFYMLFYNKIHDCFRQLLLCWILKIPFEGINKTVIKQDYLGVASKN